MMIYDRWGNLIFFTDDINKPWDGKANLGAAIAQPDVYVYTIKLKDINRKEHDYKGVVKLIR
jgi:gliding motility-associated-like protein